MHRSPVAPIREFGASFSVRYAGDLGVNWRETLTAALDDLGVRRFRLMSHWDLIEPKPGKYEFRDLDWQMDQVEARGGEVSLTIGLRQPHYPECHRPDWAREMPEGEWQQKLLDFVARVVERYRNHSALVSWQLENEALNDDFGQCVDFDPERLAAELKLVKELDPEHPVIMSLKNHHSLSVPGPRPDIYATSIYLRVHSRGRYLGSLIPAWYQRARGIYIWKRFKRPFFIHELQAEPWGPAGTQTITLEEQDKSMNPERFRRAVRYARRTGLLPIDLWGLEWWYYRKVNFDDPAMWEEAKSLFQAQKLHSSR